MIHQIDDAHYLILCDWWKAHGWAPQPKEVLSSRGFIAYREDKPIIAGFLYKDESCKLAWFEYIISNPNANDDEKTDALSELISHVEVVARSIGSLALLTTTKSDSLCKRLENNGFHVDKKEVKFLIKEV